MDGALLLVIAALSVPFGVAVYNGGWVALAVVALALMGLAVGIGRRQ